MNKRQTPQFDFSPIQRAFFDERWYASPQELAQTLTELYMDVCEMALRAEDPAVANIIGSNIYPLRMLIECLREAKPIA